ncbi:MAG: hypothetical protein Q9169_001859 [Polycauliona sp. 2 TL-2023]
MEASLHKQSVGIVPEEQKPEESQRRRSSSTKFNGLMGQKRNSADIASTARKASFAEQNKAPGMFGSMWNSFTKGNGDNSK